MNRYPMVVAGPWYAPMILNRPGEGRRVRGELYDVDDHQLTVLDALESTGKPGNFRLAIKVESFGGESMCDAIVFFKSDKLTDPIHSDFLENYQDRRFIPPNRRSSP